jgi:spermidine/putrescine-binding protein
MTGRLVKAIVVVALVAAAATWLGAGCGSSGANETGSTRTATPGKVAGELRILGYEDVTEPKYIGAFKKQYPDVNVRISAYEDGDDALAKLRAGFECDVINWCVDEPPSRLALKLGYLQPIDVSRIHDWDRIFPAFYKLPLVTAADGRHYLVPTEAGVTGIVYNTQAVEGVPDSWADLFDPRYRGKVVMMDFPATAIQIGALALGYSDPLHLSDEQLQAVEQLYLKAKKDGQFRTFYSNDSEIIDLMHSGEVVIGVGYPDNAARLQELGDPIAYTNAKESAMVWAGGYSISSKCKNLDAAYALLNYYLSPQAEKFEAEHWGYDVANQDTLKIVDAAQRKRLAEVGAWQNITVAGPPEEGYDKWIRVWQQVKLQ